MALLVYSLLPLYNNKSHTCTSSLYFNFSVRSQNRSHVTPPSERGRRTAGARRSRSDATRRPVGLRGGPAFRPRGGTVDRGPSVRRRSRRPLLAPEPTGTGPLPDRNLPALPGRQTRSNGPPYGFLRKSPRDGVRRPPVPRSCRGARGRVPVRVDAKKPKNLPHLQSCPVRTNRSSRHERQHRRSSR